MALGEADVLHLGNDSLAAGGLPSLADTGAQYYFLPAPPSAAPETSEAYDMHAVRRDFPALHQQVHGKPLVWLDNAATTQKPQSVIDALAYFYAHDNSNIHRGSHALADRATNAYEEARQKVQAFLGAAFAGGDHFHPRHHRVHQPGRPLLREEIRRRG